VEPEQAGERRAVVNFDAEPQLLIGYHKPNAPHPDNFAFEMIEQIFSRGRTSRFYKNIVEKKIAVSAWASNGSPGQRYPNLIIFGGSPQKPNGNKELEEVILTEIESLKNKKVPEKELIKIWNQVEANFVRELASNSGMASKLSYYEAVLGDWRFLLHYLEGIRSVTPEDIMRVARKYLNDRNRTVAYLEREREKN